MTARSKPKVLFITPKLPPCIWGLEYAVSYTGFKYLSPPIGIITLAGIISPDYEVELRDENVGDVIYPTDADIVGISGQLLHFYHLDRVTAIANYFRAAGKTVCIGGPVANLNPDFCRPLCDVLFEGEGEYTWPQFLKDYESGEHKDHYQQIEKIDMCKAPMPRIDLIRASDYGQGMIQTTRGCPFTCEFCDIIVMYGRKVRAKPIERVMQEVQAWADAGQDHIMFSDDNFVGNRPYVKQLLREIITFNNQRKHPLSFSTQASIDMAKDPELLALLRDANFKAIFIGVESPRKASLQETLKVQNWHTHDLVEAIRTIQSYGIFVGGGMIVGFDNDDKDIFQEQYEFLQASGFVFVQVTLLQAMPKTPLWDRMKAAGRLLDYREGLASNVLPLNMTHEELVSGCTKLLRDVYSYEAFTERYLTNLRNMNGYKFPNDRPKRSLKSILRCAGLLRYYVLTKDKERRKFFFNFIRESNKIEPKAWKWALRFLAHYIHYREYIYRHCFVLFAPLVADDAETEMAPAPKAELRHAG
ncbi:MAG TPA: radical SAM protein [Candidatus Obscuribacterales bacterium]